MHHGDGKLNYELESLVVGLMVDPRLFDDTTKDFRGHCPRLLLADADLFVVPFYRLKCQD